MIYRTDPPEAQTSSHAAPQGGPKRPMKGKRPFKVEPK
jgi:hypothetical protein